MLPDLFDRLRPRTRLVLIELTTGCNLRCAYCATSQPGHSERLLELDVEELIRFVRGTHPIEVQISGHGETTTIPGWHRVARRMHDAGLPLAITTHLAHPLQPEEIDALSCMRRITVSCDTCEPALYARIRRGGRLQALEGNLRALDEHCSARGRMRPYVAVNAVVLAETLAGLPDLARWTAARGLDALSLVNLVPYPAPPHATISLCHPAEVDREGLERALAETRLVASELRLQLNVMPGLEATLQRASAPMGAAPDASSTPTRDCVDPWETAFIQADGRVAPCCWAPPMGRIDPASPESAVVGEAARRLRASLLEGRLEPACRACPARGWTTAARLVERIDALLADDPFTELKKLRAHVKALERDLARARSSRLWRAVGALKVLLGLAPRSSGDVGEPSGP